MKNRNPDPIPVLPKLLAGLFCVAAIALLFQKPALAQPTCAGFAWGIPGNLTPPHWWDNNPPQSVYYQNLDDPRWVWAGSVNYGDGTSNNLEMRVTYDSTYIYLSWRMRHVVVGTTDNSLLYFGLQRSAGDGGGTLVVKVNLKQNNSQFDQPPGAIAALDTSLRQGDGTGLPLQPSPSYLTDTLRVWTNNPDANSWAVEVRIPQANIAVTPPTFKLWFEVITATLSTPAAFFALPSTALITQTNFNNVYPDPSTWQTVHLMPPLFSTDPACNGSGVLLLSSGIRTDSADGLTIQYLKPGGTPPGPQNTFHAYPINHAGRDIGPGEIAGRFRIANWGSAPNQWEQGVDPNVLWETIPGGDNVTNAASIPNGQQATNGNDLEFPWTVGGQDLSDFQNGVRAEHQCVMVELSSPSNNLSFVQKSTWTNMHVQSASTVSEKAQISLKGLTPIVPDGRDVYVWVETLNMPDSLPPGYKPPQLKTTVLQRLEGQPSPTPIPTPTPTPTPSPTPSPTPILEFRAPAVRNPVVVYVPQEGPPIDIPPPAQLEQMLVTGQVTSAQVEQVVPTYIVHVYHDSGNTLRLGGQDRPLLIAQGAFGEYVTHQGALTGWRHQLVGNGFTLQQLAPDFYRITKMSNDGVVTVTATIEAQEHSGVPWWLWLIVVLLIIILVLIFWRIRRRR